MYLSAPLQPIWNSAFDSEEEKQKFYVKNDERHTGAVTLKSFTNQDQAEKYLKFVRNQPHTSNAYLAFD